MVIGMASLDAVRKDLAGALDDLEPVQHAIGQFAKSEALDAVAKDVGADRQLSGMTRKAKLGAGYDLGQPVVLNLRPAGLWFLIEDGRKRRGRITVKRRSGKRAVLTPQGPRRSSSYSPSRGLSTLTDTYNAIDRGIEKAADQGVNDLLKRQGF